MPHCTEPGEPGALKIVDERTRVPATDAARDRDSGRLSVPETLPVSYAIRSTLERSPDIAAAIRGGQRMRQSGPFVDRWKATTDGHGDHADRPTPLQPV